MLLLLFAPSVCVCVYVCYDHVNAKRRRKKNNEAEEEEDRQKKKKKKKITQRRDDDGSANRLVMGYSGQAINLAHRMFYEPVNINPFVCIVAATSTAAAA